MELNELPKYKNEIFGRLTSESNSQSSLLKYAEEQRHLLKNSTLQFKCLFQININFFTYIFQNVLEHQ